MAESAARAQRTAERRQQILDVAREVAEADGWTAVTSRRLAEAIGYTQPVLYQHFPGGKTEIMRTVSLAAFAELAAATRTSVGRKTGPEAVAAVAEAYLGFARAHPALYEAMFQLPIDARFAQDDTEAELHAAFDAIAAAVDGDEGAAEVLWCALHGICQLERAGRVPSWAAAARIAVLADRFGR